MNKINTNRAILLAAGQGTRMGEITKTRPKSLLDFHGETVLSRLIRQLTESNVDNITVVVGYHKEQLIKEIKNNFGDKINIVENLNYKNDVNILSLCLGIGDDLSPFTVFEVDSVLDNVCMNKILDVGYSELSVWYSYGFCSENNMGGILKADADSKITDIRIERNYSDLYKNYRKQIGVLKVGPNEVEKYIKLLKKYCGENTKQYYLMPWIENLDILPCVNVDVSPGKIFCFNTIEQYKTCLTIFKNEK